MTRLETRELAYFVAVAEELHFGRAAQRLGMAQPPLSRAIRQLERRLGVVLLERSSRKVSLTPAGEVLLDEGRAVLAAVETAARRARRAGHRDQRLVLVVKPGADAGLLRGILAAYERESGALPVDVVFSGHEREAMLLDGRADVGLLHRPHNDLTGLDAEDLLVERQVVVVPRDHRLAGRAGVRMADLEGETLPRWRGGRSDSGTGPLVEDAGQLTQLIALGRTIAVMPESVLTHIRQDLVGIPLVDAEPIAMVIAWPQQSRSRAVAALVGAALQVAAREMIVT